MENRLHNESLSCCPAFLALLLDIRLVLAPFLEVAIGVIPDDNVAYVEKGEG